MGGVEPAREAERTVEPEVPGQQEIAEAGTEAGIVPVAPLVMTVVVTMGP